MAAWASFFPGATFVVIGRTCDLGTATFNTDAGAQTRGEGRHVAAHRDDGSARRAERPQRGDEHRPERGDTLDGRRREDRHVADQVRLHRRPAHSMGFGHDQPDPGRVPQGGHLRRRRHVHAARGSPRRRPAVAHREPRDRRLAAPQLPARHRRRHHHPSGPHRPCPAVPGPHRRQVGLPHRDLTGPMPSRHRPSSRSSGPAPTSPCRRPRGHKACRSALPRTPPPARAPRSSP